MPQESSSPQGFRVLVIVSRPLDLPDLPNLADQWALQGGLRRVQAPAFLKMLRPPTVQGLRDERFNRYDIVHFDGHGGFGLLCPACGSLHSPQEKKCDRCKCLLDSQEAKGYFAFEKEDGKLDTLAAEELAEIVMSAPGNPTKLVFLSACQSAKGGQASLLNALLGKGVPAVLGMNESITVKATMALATHFYAGLGAGMTISRAFENALPTLNRLENGGKLQKIPVLEGPGKDVKILSANVAGRASFEVERLFGLPEHEFVGDYIRGYPPHGRKGLLSQAMNALQNGEKLVVLTGQGGIGKTVLASEAARRLAYRYPGGVFWRSAVEMERLGLDEMLNAFDNVFGQQLRTLPIDTKLDQVLGYLRNYDTASLLVVDNAESIQDQNLWRFLEGIPQPSAALVTTRESLPREGREIRVPEMETEEADRLLISEARRRSPMWGEHLSQADRQNLNEIASFMQGHPLAIKLTAALMARRSLASIRDELGGNPPKEVSKRFDVSYNSLMEGQRDLFCRLAVFSGSMTEEAIGSICIEVDQKGRSDWQSDLGELVRRFFLDKIEIAALDKEGNKVTIHHYRLHPLMRQYAIAKAGVAVQTYLSRAAHFFLKFAKSNPSFHTLEHEHENILASADWAYASGEWAMVKEYALAVDYYLATRGYWKDRGKLLRQAIKAGHKMNDKSGVAEMLHRMGNLAYATGHLDKAWRQYQKSLKINQLSVSITLHQMGMMANATGDLEKAKSLYEESLKIKLKLGDRLGEAKTLHHLGIMAYDRGDLDEAGRLYDESLKIKLELGNRLGEAKTLHQMAVLAYDTGKIKEARMLYQKSLKIKRELQLRDKRGEAITLHHLGNLANATGDLKEAKSRYEESLRIKQELSDKRGVAITLHQLGNLAYLTGDLSEAGRLFQESLKIRLKLRDKNGEAKTLHKMGNIAYDTGNLDEACKLYEQSFKIKQELGDKSGMSKTLHKNGNIAYAKGNLEEARNLYEDSLRIKMELRDKRGEAITKNQMGNIAYEAGNLEEAEKQYAESLRIEQELEDKRGIAQSQHNLGNVAYANGDLIEAEKKYHESLEIERKLKNQRGVAQTLHNLGIIAFVNGDPEKANMLYLKSFMIKQRLGDKQGIAITLYQLGNIAYNSGDLAEARSFYQESLKIDTELKNKLGIAITEAQYSFLEKKVGKLNNPQEKNERAKEIFLQSRLEKKGR